MNRKEIEEQVIRNFQRDEQMMIMVFAQWCVNHGLDPALIYARAYPQQIANAALQQAIELTVPPEEAGEITVETLLGVLSLYDNEELASIVTEELRAQLKDKNS
ncbi:MAG: hypothetical protein K0Q81_339 [Paenibacillus sp.]|jgi:hypothetical protein|nr:hypothetical protein [Paenibacillus sp.]